MVILSKKLIEPGKEDGITSETSFTGSDNIYVYVKLIAPLKKWKGFNPTTFGIVLQ